MKPARHSVMSLINETGNACDVQVNGMRFPNAILTGVDLSVNPTYETKRYNSDREAIVLLTMHSRLKLEFDLQPEPPPVPWWKRLIDHLAPEVVYDGPWPGRE